MNRDIKLIIDKLDRIIVLLGSQKEIRYTSVELGKAPHIDNSKCICHMKDKITGIRSCPIHD